MELPLAPSTLPAGPVRRRFDLDMSSPPGGGVPACLFTSGTIDDRGEAVLCMLVAIAGVTTDTAFSGVDRSSVGVEGVVSTAPSPGPDAAGIAAVGPLFSFA